MYTFIDSEKKIKEAFDTREKLFSFIISKVSIFGSYKSLDEVFIKVALNNNDTYSDWYFGLGIGGTLKPRPIMVFEDGKVFDIRRYKKEIENTPKWLYIEHTERQEMNLDGYSFPTYAKRPRYKHYIKEVADPESKPFSRVSNKRWWYFEPDFPDGTRSWKNQTKSRKQWAKKKKNPIGRIENPLDEAIIAEEEDMYYESLMLGTMEGW